MEVSKFSDTDFVPVFISKTAIKPQMFIKLIDICVNKNTSHLPE